MWKWNKIYRFTLLTFIVIICAFPIKASDFSSVFEHFSTNDGLSHGSISSMIKDSRGFMWFATWDGLSRYDGFNFKTYKQNSNIASNRIRKLSEDLYGNIWFITDDRKCFRINHKTESIEPLCYPQTDSLVQNVMSVFHSSLSDVWILTSRNGLFRIATNSVTNLLAITHFTQKSELAISGNSIYSVFEDFNKNIWVNTENGLTFLAFDTSTGKYFKKPFSPSCQLTFAKLHITSLINYKGNIILGTDAGTMFKYNPVNQTCEEIDLANSSSITTIISNGRGYIYVGTHGNGIIEYNPLRKEIRNHFLQPSMRIIYRMYLDEKDLLWIESSKPGISCVNLRNSDYRHFQQKLQVNPDVRNEAQCGLMEEDKYIWITLKGGGFGYYDYANGQLNYFFNDPEDPNSKLSNFVNGFYKDKSGVMWISTYFKGLDKITILKNPIQYQQLVPQNKFSIANEVRAMLIDSKGQFWIATKNQEVFILNESFEIVQKIHSYQNKSLGRVYCLMEDSKGTIYLGTKGNGLFTLVPQKDNSYRFHHYTNSPEDSLSLSSNNLYSLLEDDKGNIWIGTYGGGINIFNGSNFINITNSFNEELSVGALKVRHIVKDLQGNIWAGTTDGILFIETSSDTLNMKWFNSTRNNMDGMYGKDVFWIYPDSKHNVWFATLGGGLSKLQNYPLQDDILHFNSLTKKDGLSSNMIFAITEDIYGDLWMSSENGIIKYNKENNSINTYTKLSSNTNPVFSEGSLAKHANGNISFGANNGFYTFSPSSFNTYPEKLNILFTGFQLFNKDVVPGDDSPLANSITISKSIRLKYNQNVFSISWSSLNYYMQNSLQYQYKLLGYEDQWNRVSANGKASYNKVPPGKYTFIVQVLNKEFQKLNPSKEIELIILPPIWKSKLAYLVYILLSVLILFLARNITITIIRLRNKVIIEKEITEIKLNFFTNISHELRTPLTLITGPIKEIAKNENLSEKGQTMVRIVEQNTQRLLKMVNRLLDFRRIQSNKFQLDLKEIELNKFLQPIIRNFKQLAKEKSVSLQFIPAENEIVCTIDEEKMEIVMINLLSNAFKFIPVNGHIKIYLNKEKTGNKVFIKVEDNGPGIQKEQESSLFEIFSSYHSPEQKNYMGSGIGLALSKEFVKLHEGDIYYQPTPGGGASFIIQLKTSVKSKQPQTYFEKELDKKEIKLSESLDKGEGCEIPSLLIVEDNQELRDFLHLQLSEDFLIIEAQNGEVGFLKTVSSQPDIIISDIMMPVMDGIELLDKVKNNFETSHIPVVLLSAKTSVESKIEGLKYGADAYITKPFHIEQVIAQLNNLLKQRENLRKLYTQANAIDRLIEKTGLTEADAEFLQKVREIVNENVSNPLFKMNILYRELGMGRTKFYNKLKGLTDISPVDFVKEFRLNYAYNLLQTGKYNVSEASDMSGFSDPGYFCKRFKEHFGDPPSVFMKRPDH